MTVVTRIPAVVAAATLAAALPATTSPAQAHGTSWQDVTAATARFHSLEQAERAGYHLASPCTSSPAGAMGFHFENAELMADPAIDPLKPEILLYATGPGGNLKLVAVEYWKSADGPGTVGEHPSVLGQPFNGPMPGHHPGMATHYDLHVWLWQANPLGTFAPFNPTVNC